MSETLKVFLVPLRPDEIADCPVVFWCAPPKREPSVVTVLEKADLFGREWKVNHRGAVKRVPAMDLFRGGKPADLTAAPDSGTTERPAAAHSVPTEDPPYPSDGPAVSESTIEAVKGIWAVYDPDRVEVPF